MSDGEKDVKSGVSNRFGMWILIILLYIIGKGIYNKVIDSHGISFMKQEENELFKDYVKIEGNSNKQNPNKSEETILTYDPETGEFIQKN